MKRTDGPSFRRNVSLARALSKRGITSRASARTMIVDGRVAVNGVVVRNPDVRIHPERDRIRVDGEPASRRSGAYLVLHKPAGIVTTRSDERGRRTVYDLLPRDHPWVFPVGRLDKESSGVLLMTNDTRFGERLTDPDEHVPKEYHVTLDQTLRQSDRATMEQPMVLRDGTRLRPARVIPENREGTSCIVTIREGKNRQIRKMFEQRGYRVLRLHRTAVGGIRLGDLEEGRYRSLSAQEVASILKKQKHGHAGHR